MVYQRWYQITDLSEICKWTYSSLHQLYFWNAPNIGWAFILNCSNTFKEAAYPVLRSITISLLHRAVFQCFLPGMVCHQILVQDYYTGEFEYSPHWCRRTRHSNSSSLHQSQLVWGHGTGLGHLPLLRKIMIQLSYGNSADRCSFLNTTHHKYLVLKMCSWQCLRTLGFQHFCHARKQILRSILGTCALKTLPQRMNLLHHKFLHCQLWNCILFPFPQPNIKLA